MLTFQLSLLFLCVQKDFANASTIGNRQFLTNTICASCQQNTFLRQVTFLLTITCLIVLSEDFVDIFKRNNQIGIQTHIEYDLAHSRLHLSDKQFNQINVAFDLLKTVSDVGTLYRKDMMLNIFNTIMMMRHEFSPLSNTHSPNNGRILSARFKQTVIDHHRESHEVGYYARMFNLSPKYFSTLIKQEIGISATDWIKNHIALRAKSILAQQTDVPMQQISDLLGFTEQTSFSR